MELNETQTKALDNLNTFLTDPDAKYFYLLGYAGTGKTFLISRLIKNLLIDCQTDNIYVCASTRQALQVIESYIRSQITPGEYHKFVTMINFFTAHKLLEFKPVIMADDGVKKFVSKSESKFLKQLNKKLIIVDECSMIDKEIYGEIIKYPDIYPVKIIFMGDPGQLPPINEDISMIFKNIPENYPYVHSLDKVMRTKSSDIQKVSTIVRNWNRKDSISKLLLVVHQSDTKPKEFKLFHKKTDYLNSSWFKFLVQKINKNVMPIILTYKNITANNYNKIVRNYLHQTDQLNNYLKGDTVIFNNYYAVENEKFYTSDVVKIFKVETNEIPLLDWSTCLIKEKNDISKAYNQLIKKLKVLSSNIKVDTLTVERIRSDFIDIAKKKKFKIKTINCSDIDKYHDLRRIISEHIKNFNKKYNNQKKVMDLWSIYHKSIVDPYAQINFSHAMTVHKAQGSTFNTTFIDLNDLSEMKDANLFQKAFITAAGRPSSFLGIII